MSGFEIVGVLLGVYPLVINAVQVYKATKTRRAAGSLVRILTTEQIIYHQFVQNLLAANVSDKEMRELLEQETPGTGLWLDPTLHDNIHGYLGTERADLVLEILRDIDGILRALNSELSNVDRGIDVLAKFLKKVRSVKQILPKSSVRQQLEALNFHNVQLSRLLGDQHTRTQRETKERLKPTKFLFRDCKQAVELYEVIRDGYECDCADAHIANFGLHSPSQDSLFAAPNLDDQQWVFEIIFPPGSEAVPQRRGLTVPVLEATPNDIIEVIEDDELSNENMPRRLSAQDAETVLTRERTRSLSISEIVEISGDESERQSLIKGLCSFMEEHTDALLVSDDCLVMVGSNNKKYKLDVTPDAGETSKTTICLDDLLKADKRSSLSRQDKMQLALILSCSILQFSSTPWIDKCWTWKDFCILINGEAQQKQLSRLFVTRRFYSATQTASLNPILDQPQSPLSLLMWDDEPILTKLGFALTELALGKSLRELREEHSQALGSLNENIGIDSLDLHTAQFLLKSGRIAQQEGRGYEEVVRACLKHQYRWKAEVKGLDSRDETFFDNVEECIIGPLFSSYTNSWGTVQA